MNEQLRRGTFPFPSSTNRPPATAVWSERRRLADAMRSVIEQLVTSEASPEELRDAAAGLEHLAAQLATRPRRGKPTDFKATLTPDEINALFDFSPLLGLSNPIAPPLELTMDGDCIRGQVRFGAAYEGPPGCVHGGCIAAVFDELLGYTQSITQRPGITGTLTIRYRVPTPLHTQLHCEARVERISGRKIFCSGQLFCGETLCAEAEGIFLSLR